MEIDVCLSVYKYKWVCLLIWFDKGLLDKSSLYKLYEVSRRINFWNTYYYSIKKTINRTTASENTEGQGIESNHFVICFVCLLDVVMYFKERT